ncbi:MAG: DUF4838 domain-containing protein [Planctomycetota bacterium]
MSFATLLLAAITIVDEGRPQVRLEHDGTAAAAAAAEILQRHVVLIAKTALPQQGDIPALRFESAPFDGYRIESREKGVVVSGRFAVLAVYDLLRGWGCRFDSDAPHLPQLPTLSIKPREWRNSRPLYVETDRLDLAMAATGISVRGLHRAGTAMHARAKEYGYRIRVASTSFDDFLPVELFEKHREFFALRRGARHPRGNFALTNADARRAYLDRVETWLDEHPEVDCLGLWPRVTTVWCEESKAHGHAESYALLWREAAKRFPKSRFEILATGLTLKPPAGKVPRNIEVRLRPGRDASALQGVAVQAIEAVVRAWEVRGAKVLLEIDGAPESWCGLPWPNHDAVRADATRAWGAVLVHPDRTRAMLWHDPRARVTIDEELAGLLGHARVVRSWGDPADAARLWPEPGPSLGARAGEVERLRERAMRPEQSETARREDATRAWFQFGALAHDLGRRYRRQMEQRMRTMLKEVLPEGAEAKVGPATVRETIDRVEVETAQLRLIVERHTATVVGLHRRHGTGWSGDLLGKGGRGFAVVALAQKSARTAGEVRVRAGKRGEARVELAGLIHAGGARWKASLLLDGSSARVRQEASVDAAGGIAVGFRFEKGTWDEWVCPSYAREGKFTHPATSRQASFRIVPDELLYVAKAPRGFGVALQLPHGGVASIVDGEDATLLTTSIGRRIVIDWIVFAGTGELGK